MSLLNNTTDTSTLPSRDRESFVDYAKGMGIILVVMMHSTLGVEQSAGSEGWLHAAVSFARPFRLPDFFLVAGLFLSRSIGQSWKPEYLDKKVFHFAYLYLLWLGIQLAYKKSELLLGAPSLFLKEYLFGLIEPFGTLWFIYMLAIFCVVTKALRLAPPMLVLFGAAILQIAPIHSGWLAIDEFSERYVYFFIGYSMSQYIFQMAYSAMKKPQLAMLIVAFWALINGAAVYYGFADLPILSLILGVLGASMVVVIAALLSHYSMANFIRYCGQNSLSIYLPFAIPMALARIGLLKYASVLDIGTISALVTIFAIAASLAFHWLVRDTQLKYLYERPAFLKWSKKAQASKGEKPQLLSPAQ